MSDIFLSYANEDLPRIMPLVRVLEAHGWSVWWDRTIPPGRVFDEVIEAALDDARCVVVAWSQVPITRHWVRTEAEEGRQRGILVPVQIDRELRIPLAFRLIQAAHLSDWDGTPSHAEFQRFVRAVGERLGLPVAVRAEPSVPPPVPEQAATPPQSITNSLGMELVRIAAGAFHMGSENGNGDERPVHAVRISQPFYLGKYPVTQG